MQLTQYAIRNGKFSKLQSISFEKSNEIKNMIQPVDVKDLKWVEIFDGMPEDGLDNLFIQESKKRKIIFN